MQELRAKNSIEIQIGFYSRVLQPARIRVQRKFVDGQNASCQEFISCCRNSIRVTVIISGESLQGLAVLLCVEML